jgi:CBS domain-containing protein
MTKVRDVMTSKVITVNEGTRIKDLCRLLGEYNISGIPVVTDEGELTGIVSDKDVVAHQVASLEPDFVDPDIYELISSKFLGMSELTPGQGRMYVEEIMNRDVVAVSPDTLVEEATKILLEKRLHRLPVVEEGKVVGIVSSLDLLRGILRTKVLKEESTGS